MLRTRPSTEVDPRQADEYRPLALTRREAAKMCGISVQTFDSWVRKAVLPPAMPGTRRWSRVAIERRLAADSTTPFPSEALSPFEQWKQGNAH